MNETLKHNGYKITIEQDYDPQNPRDGDNLFIMACFHKRYDLGDENHGIDHQDFDSWDEMEDYIRRRQGAVLIKPLFMYDHSMLDIATEVKPYWWHYRWDGGQVGFIYTTHKRVKEFLGWKRVTRARLAKLYSYLEGEVDEYARYLRGEVYGFMVEDPSGYLVDSCYGFYDLDECRAAAKECIPVEAQKSTGAGQ
jgi:hypothetical protein